MSMLRHIAVIAITILLLAAFAFIWGNSLNDIPASRVESAQVVEVVKPELEPVVDKGNVTDHLVRKLAHFV